MARRATFVDSIRAITENTLVVDAGNWGDLNPTWGELKSDFIFKTMKRIGYDAVSPGERELRRDVQHFAELAEGQPAVLLSNVYTERNGVRAPVSEPYTIREMDGHKVGIFSLMHSDVVERAVQAPQPLVADDVFTSADRIVSDLKDAGCDVLVLLSQMELAFTDSVVRRQPDIDVAVLGHRGGLRATHTTVGSTIIVRPGTRGQYIAWLEMEVDETGTVVQYDGRSQQLDEKAARKDPHVQTLVNEMDAEIKRIQKEERLAKQAEFQNQQEVDRFLGADTCARCHQTEFEKWQQGPHARAWATLVDMGMESNDDCVSCHVTGKGAKTGFQSATMKPDLTAVQCEACHQMGTLHPGDKTLLTANTCTSCHDQANSPDFDAKTYMEMIRHW